jgi:hypothetical protein
LSAAIAGVVLSSLHVHPWKGGDAGMKKTMSPRALAKEAAFWETIKKGSKDPGTVCRK